MAISLQGFIDTIKPSWWVNTANPVVESGAPVRNGSAYIAPVQLQRLRQDVDKWRQAINETENVWYPHRVAMQRLYIDTILNGHVTACIDRRRDITLLRDWHIATPEGVTDEAATQLLNAAWFQSLMQYVLDAQFFGYSLVALGDLVNDSFPKLNLIKRWNVSPERRNITTFTYSISGLPFDDPDFTLGEAGSPYDWHIWVPTTNEIGTSDCGYGLLYKCAMYEIICRNLIGFNSDSAELFGVPMRVGKTTKTDETERGELFDMLVNMGHAGVALMDTTDELELVERHGDGRGFMIYENLEQRCEKKISKILLGHADALDSTPGKLGNDSGESPAQKALEDIQSKDGAFIENVLNGQVLPKLRKLGLRIPDTVRFCFKNDHELQEIREREDETNQKTALIAKTMKDAGLQMDPSYFAERTGIPTTPVPAPIAPPAPGGALPEDITNKLKNLYA